MTTAIKRHPYRAAFVALLVALAVVAKTRSEVYFRHRSPLIGWLSAVHAVVGVAEIMLPSCNCH